MQKLAKIKIALLPIVLIIILGFIAYFNSLNGKFIWDDEFLIKENQHIKDWRNLKIIFTEDIGAGSELETRFYRPLQMVTYLLDYSVWKLNVRGYHLTNILLHILAALAIYWLAQVLYNNKYFSCLSGALFVVCPLHTEAVAYISGRADPLSAIFILLSIIFYIKQVTLKNSAAYILMLLSYIFALLSKEYSLITPALLLVYSFSFRKKLLFKEFFSILVVTFIYIILRLKFLHLPANPDTVVYTVLSQRTPGFFAAISGYFRLIFLPFGLHMEYGKVLFNFSDYRVISGAVFLFTLLIYAFKKRIAGALVSFSIFWFFIALLPSSNLYPINAYMAEHWLYLPSMGFFMILANFLVLLYRKKIFRNIAIGLMIAIPFFYSFLTIKQNNIWKDHIAFYKRTLKYAPASFKVYHNLGKAYMEAGNYSEAIKSLEKAIELYPKHANTYINLGSAYNSIRDFDKAVSAYLKAIQLNPKHADAYYNMGNAYAKSGDIEKAAASYEKAIEIAPNKNHSAAYYSNLSCMYVMSGKIDKAIAMLDKVLEINPSNVQARENLRALLNSAKESGKNPVLMKQ